jgi:hypothetical protein
MTMGWMETIRFIGLDLQVATLFAVASLGAASRAIQYAWGRIPRNALWRGSARPGRVPSARGLTPPVSRPASQRSATAPGRP